MKALRVGIALFLASGCTLAACANGESDIGNGYVGGGKGGTDAGIGGSSFGGSSFGGSSGQGFGGSSFGGSSGQGFGGTGADGGTGGAITGGTGGVGATGGTGGIVSGGTGGSTGGTGGIVTGGTGGSTGGTGGIVTGGTGGTGGSTGGTGGTTNIIPTTCPQSHGLIGCCGSDNANYYWECAKLNKIQCAGGCGWNATAGYYDCGFTGTDPSGTYPRECGGANPAPANQCPGLACCLPSCPTQAPAGCYCDIFCTLNGDCCPDANSC